MQQKYFKKITFFSRLLRRERSAIAATMKSNVKNSAVSQENLEDYQKKRTKRKGKHFISSPYIGKQPKITLPTALLDVLQ